MHPGVHVDSAVLELLRAFDAEARAVEMAYRLLAIRLRSRRELADRLRRRGTPPATVDRLLETLERDGLIDDARFAQAWVQGRLALRPSGPVCLRQELLKKGVSKDIIERVLAQALSEQNEEQLALELARARLRRYQSLPREVVYRRLGGLLHRRGFSSDVVAGVLRQTVGTLLN